MTWRFLVDHHWAKGPLASPDGWKLYVGAGSNSKITENRIQAEYERAAIWEVDIKSGAHRFFAQSAP
jgi:glucose/arabinose dehydrogenase